MTSVQKQLDWNFEPCDPEGRRNANGKDFTHATRGRRPDSEETDGTGRPVIHEVVGYGFSQDRATEKAHEKAREYDQDLADRKATERYLGKQAEQAIKDMGIVAKYTQVG